MLVDCAVGPPRRNRNFHEFYLLSYWVFFSVMVLTIFTMYVHVYTVYHVQMYKKHKDKRFVWKLRLEWMSELVAIIVYLLSICDVDFICGDIIFNLNFLSIYFFFLVEWMQNYMFRTKKYKEISNFMCISERIVSINTPTHAMSWCWFVHVFPEYIPMWYMNLIYISDTVNKICLSKLRNCQNSYHE